ncbi:MAG TPA: WD40 repeat domain-containing protein [Longimicrobium sp.]|nr:WD40 repeat domain-containing protein [Longimicrobium sp.]
MRPSSILFLPGGTSLAVADSGRVSIYDARSGSRTGEVPGAAGGSLAVSPDGKFLASATSSGQGPLVIHEIAAWKEVLRVPTSDSGTLSFSPDGKLLAVGSGYPSYVQVLDVATGKTNSHLRGAQDDGCQRAGGAVGRHARVLARRDQPATKSAMNQNFNVRSV